MHFQIRDRYLKQLATAALCALAFPANVLASSQSARPAYCSPENLAVRHPVAYGLQETLVGALVVFFIVAAVGVVTANLKLLRPNNEGVSISAMASRRLSDFFLDRSYRFQRLCAFGGFVGFCASMAGLGMISLFFGCQN